MSLRVPYGGYQRHSAFRCALLAFGGSSPTIWSFVISSDADLVQKKIAQKMPWPVAVGGMVLGRPSRWYGIFCWKQRRRHSTHWSLLKVGNDYGNSSICGMSQGIRSFAPCWNIRCHDCYGPKPFQSGDFHVSGQESVDFGDMSKKTITGALISSATTIVLKIKSPIYRPKQRPMTAGPGASEPPRRSWDFERNEAICCVEMNWSFTWGCFG